MKRVCIVGAGAVGLCAAKHLSDCPGDFRFTVFEQQGDIGGTWNYTPRTGTDDYGLPVHSSMYKNLKTNLPMQVMAYPDLPYTKEGPSFVEHPVVLDYIHEYAEKFNILKHIKFHQKVQRIGLSSAKNEDDLWKVDVQDVRTKASETHEFDAVMICVGAYSKPRCPEIPGIGIFEGRVVHSHDYRTPDEFANLNVVVLGAGSSGIDLAIEIETVANQVMLSHGKPNIFNANTKPERLTEVPCISSVNQNTVQFLNGTTFEADVIILCTGYELTAPSLLDANVGLEQDGRRFPSLYKHLLHIHHPSLAVFAVVFLYVPFPIVNQQVLFILSLWKGDWKLPPKDEMFEDIEQDFRKKMDKGWPTRYAHCIAGDLQWQLVEEMETISSVPRLPKYYKEIYEIVHGRRTEEPRFYKRDNFVVENSTVKHIPATR